jgi:hypothetical protein
VIESGGETLVENGPSGKPSANNEARTKPEIQSDGNLEPDPINVINPFIALGWIIFVGPIVTTAPATPDSFPPPAVFPRQGGISQGMPRPFYAAWWTMGCALMTRA